MLSFLWPCVAAVKLNICFCLYYLLLIFCKMFRVLKLWDCCLFVWCTSSLQISPLNNLSKFIYFKFMSLAISFSLCARANSFTWTIFTNHSNSLYKLLYFFILRRACSSYYKTPHVEGGVKFKRRRHYSDSNITSTRWGTTLVTSQTCTITSAVYFFSKNINT